MLLDGNPAHHVRTHHVSSSVSSASSAAKGALLHAVSYLGLRHSSRAQLVSSARLSAALLGALGKVPACESKVQPGSPNPSGHVAQRVSVSSTCTTQTAQ